MPVGASFYIENVPGGVTAYQHTAGSSNTSGGSTYLNNPAANGNPNAIVHATPIYNPGGGYGGVTDSANIGVYYDPYRGLWAVFNQNRSPMPMGDPLRDASDPAMGNL